MGFAFGNQQWRASVKSTTFPIWAEDSSRPARGRLIESNTELFPGMGIVSKLDIRVEFGSNRLIDGWCKLEMMTFREKRRFVFSLAPTAFDYAKLGAYFGKCKNRKLGPCKCGGFRAPFGCAEGEPNQESTAGRGGFNAIVLDMEVTIPNTSVRMVNALSGSGWSKLARRN